MSSRPAFLLLALLATALGAVIATELDQSGPVEDPTGIVPIHHAPLARARAPSEDPVDHTDAWVETILARPLFSRDRRPTPVVSKANGEVAMTTLPRLSGVMVSNDGRWAIFAAADGGKTTVATLGTALGPYTVDAIEPGEVTVSGPDGVVQLHLAFDATARKAALAETPQLPPPPAIQAPGQAPGQLPGQAPILLPGQPPLMPQPLGQRAINQFQRALPQPQIARPPQQIEIDP